MNETYETLFLILFLFQLKLCSFSFSDAKVRRISLRNKKNRHFFPDLLRQQARYATKQGRSGICCRKNQHELVVIHKRHRLKYST